MSLGETSEPDTEATGRHTATPCNVCEARQKTETRRSAASLLRVGGNELHIDITHTVGDNKFERADGPEPLDVCGFPQTRIASDVGVWQSKC